MVFGPGQTGGNQYGVDEWFADDLRLALGNVIEQERDPHSFIDQAENGLQLTGGKNNIGGELILFALIYDHLPDVSSLFQHDQLFIAQFRHGDGRKFR